MSALPRWWVASGVRYIFSQPAPFSSRARVGRAERNDEGPYGFEVYDIKAPYGALLHVVHEKVESPAPDAEMNHHP